MKLIASAPLKVGGKRREPGELFECDDAVGEELLQSGDALVASDAEEPARHDKPAEGKAKAKPRAPAKGGNG